MVVAQGHGKTPTIGSRCLAPVVAFRGVRCWRAFDSVAWRAVRHAVPRLGRRLVKWAASTWGRVAPGIRDVISRFVVGLGGSRQPTAGLLVCFDAALVSSVDLGHPVDAVVVPAAWACRGAMLVATYRACSSQRGSTLRIEAQRDDAEIDAALHYVAHFNGGDAGGIGGWGTVILEVIWHDEREDSVAGAVDETRSTGDEQWEPDAEVGSGSGAHLAAHSAAKSRGESSDVSRLDSEQDAADGRTAAYGSRHSMAGFESRFHRWRAD